MAQRQKRSQSRHPRRVRVLDEHFHEHGATAIERNGNLTYVERDDGEIDWLSPDAITED